MPLEQLVSQVMSEILVDRDPLERPVPLDRLEIKDELEVLETLVLPVPPVPPEPLVLRVQREVVDRLGL